MKRALFLFLAALPTVAPAKTIWNKSYQWSAETLEKIESAITKAKGRPHPESSIYIDIDGSFNITVMCDAHQPDADRKGCMLQGSLTKDASTFSLSFSKPLNGKVLAESVREEISKKDANTTEGHLHFGSLFDGADGSHYECQAEGEEGKKSWVCYLNIREELN